MLSDQNLLNFKADFINFSLIAGLFAFYYSYLGIRTRIIYF